MVWVICSTTFSFPPNLLLSPLSSSLISSLYSFSPLPDVIQRLILVPVCPVGPLFIEKLAIRLSLFTLLHLVCALEGEKISYIYIYT